MKILQTSFPALLLAVFITACTQDNVAPEQADILETESDELLLDESFLDESGLLKILGQDFPVSDRSHQSTVFTLSNETDDNEVIVFNRSNDGSLEEAGRYSTGGTGTGGGLGNQGALTLSNGGKFLFAVNAGSNDISYFLVNNDGTLELKDRIDSGGEMPVSIAFRNNLVYVLNAGGSGSITGFKFNQQGDFVMIENSTKPLSSSSAGAAQISFSTNGKVLIVTEKATNIISTYPVLYNGTTASARTFTAAGTTPFGFAVGRSNNFFVSEAAGGAPGASTVSAYHVSNWGQVSLVDGPFATNETAACWVVLANNNHTLFATNTGSNNISSLSVSYFGKLDFSNGSNTAPAMDGPIDAAVDRASKNLYVLAGGTDAILSYEIGQNGQLTQIDEDAVNLPENMTGLVVR